MVIPFPRCNIEGMAGSKMSCSHAVPWVPPLSSPAVPSSDLSPCVRLLWAPEGPGPKADPDMGAWAEHVLNGWNV